MYTNRDKGYSGDFLAILDMIDLQKGDVFLDLGANVGQEIDFFSRLGAEMHSYEPHPYNYKILKLKYESEENVKIYNKAVWTENSKQKLILKYSADSGRVDEGCSLISGKTNLGTDSYMVDCVDICDIVSELPSIKVLKINIEGAEYHLLRKLIEEDLFLKPEYIFVDDHSRKMNCPEFTENLNFVKNYVLNNGIKIFRW